MLVELRVAELRYRAVWEVLAATSSGKSGDAFPPRERSSSTTSKVTGEGRLWLPREAVPNSAGD
jgi:hypothetical protein